MLTGEFHASGARGLPSAGVGGQRGCPEGEEKKLPINPSDLVAQLARATVKGEMLSLPLPDGKGEAQFKRSL